MKIHVDRSMSLPRPETTEVLTMFQIEEPGSIVTFDWQVIETIAAGDNPMRMVAKALLAARSTDFHAGFSCGLVAAALTVEGAAQAHQKGRKVFQAFSDLAKTIRAGAYQERILHGAGRDRVTGGGAS